MSVSMVLVKTGEHRVKWLLSFTPFDPHLLGHSVRSVRLSATQHMAEHTVAGKAINSADCRLWCRCKLSD